MVCLLFTSWEPIRKVAFSDRPVSNINSSSVYSKNLYKNIKITWIHINKKQVG